jgi:cyclic pyranopterin monophosphate synthase
MDTRLTHLDEEGRARMVDVGQKPSTARLARAEGRILMPPELIATLSALKKGNAYEVARLAGIMAAKRTSDLIPLCHSLPLDHVRVDFQPMPDQGYVRVEAEVACTGRTGVEMEALTAVNFALLTLYDMGKAVARDMSIEGVRLIYKRGGKSGEFIAPPCT